MRCKDASRREFLQRGSACGLFTLAALGLAAEATVLPVTLMAGSGDGEERSYDIPAADGVTIDRKSQVMLVRYGNHLFAMAMACPHEQAAVKWVKKDGRFQCTKHDSQYKPDGTYVTGHATRNLDRFPIRREDAKVLVNISKVYQSDKQAAGWAAATVTL
jgi:Rieske Fe-S protein